MAEDDRTPQAEAQLQRILLRRVRVGRMGNSRAYPVFRTTDVVEAWTQALRLSALLEERDNEVILMADLLTVEDARRMAAVLPEAEFDYAGPRMDP